jgi:methionyl-tRNA formyltransferase
MRLLLFADGDVGRKIANFLFEKFRQDLVLVVTTKENDIYRNAELNGIPVCVYDSEKNIENRILCEVDLGLLAWWPKILKSTSLMKLPKRGFVNTHPSLLPYNRGKHYNFWAIVEQAPFGVTLHLVDSLVDNGDIIAQAEITYDWCDTGETLYKKAQVSMLDLFINTYPLLRTNTYILKPQDKNIGSFHRASELEYASKIQLDSIYSARALLNLLRARTFAGYPGCEFEENNSRYEISVTIKKVS